MQLKEICSKIDFELLQGSLETEVVDRGIMTGMTATILNPTGDATRAQTATMIMRFFK